MKTYDLHFNDDQSSDCKGFKLSIDKLINYIDSNNGSYSSFWGTYKNGTVSIVCNEDGITVFETKVI